jgi:protocatechuate 3,4-dioxygenase beta subunit
MVSRPFLLSILAVSVFFLSVNSIPAEEERSKTMINSERGTPQRESRCEPTPEDSLGPFYLPGAPIRSSVGKGYILSGSVKSAKDCSFVPGAKIEFWLAGPDGAYNDEHRATVLSDSQGNYRFESNFPPRYSFRPSHIHIRVSNPGYRVLVTQHYPKKGSETGEFDLVLVPES